MVTAKSNIHDIVTGIDTGADDFISKPFVKEELLVRIRAGERVLGFETRDIVIFSMAKLAESRDPETGNHLERIRYYSKALAETIASSENPLRKSIASLSTISSARARCTISAKLVPPIMCYLSLDGLMIRNLKS